MTSILLIICFVTVFFITKPLSDLEKMKDENEIHPNIKKENEKLRAENQFLWDKLKEKDQD